MVDQNDGWKSHEEEQLRRWCSLTPQERLDWLWQAKIFAEEARKSAEARRPAPAAAEVGPKYGR